MRSFSKKILNYRIVGAYQSFQIFWLNTCSLKSNRALPKFPYGILHYLINISNYNKISPKKTIYFNHTSHLNILSISLFFCYFLKLNIKKRKHALEIFSWRFEVIFEVQVWQILIELKYQFFFMLNLKFDSICFELT